MKQYLLIRNKGLIIPQDIILMGSSTKRGDDTKIGQFGSGSKFALSWLMRNDCKPIIYSGKSQISIETQMVEHRGHPRDVIYVQGENTNITTELGLKWTCWMAIRELISNAIDEGDELVDVIYSNDPSKHCEDGYTSIFVPVNKQLSEVMDKYDHYFAFDRAADYIDENCMIYLRSTNDTINVYRKGIRCADFARNTMFDINFNNIDITEDRLIDGGEGTFDHKCRYIFEKITDVNVLKHLILSEYRDIMPDTPTVAIIQAYRELITAGHKFTTDSMKNSLGALTEGMLIPAKHFRALIDNNLVSNPIESIFQHLDFLFKPINGPSVEVEKLLAQFGNFKVFFGKMDTYKDVKIKDNEFYVKHIFIEKDVKYIASQCIIAHPKSSMFISQLL